MITILITLFLITSTIALAMLYLWFKRQSHGSLSKEKIYSDSDSNPGETLYASSIPLMGRPDYLVRDGDMIIPVEVKTGKTPQEPYENHIMQLMAYCYLVEENYGIRPHGGILKYPDQEFKLVYTDEAKAAIQSLTAEITNATLTNEEPTCSHPEHN